MISLRSRAYFFLEPAAILAESVLRYLLAIWLLFSFSWHLHCQHQHWCVVLQGLITNGHLISIYMAYTLLAV